jgi:hypothetical protein
MALAGAHFQRRIAYLPVFLVTEQDCMKASKSNSLNHHCPS